MTESSMAKPNTARKSTPRAASARAEPSRKAPKAAKMGDMPIEAMEEVVGHRKGKIALPSRIVHAPERLDVAAIRKGKGLVPKPVREALRLRAAHAPGL
jgi:hypothetical protein